MWPTGARLVRPLPQGRHVDTGPAFAYYRDWITDPDGTYATAASAARAQPEALPLRRRQAVDNRRRSRRAAGSYSNRLVPTSHSESSLYGALGLPDPAPYDTAGTYADWTSAPLTRTCRRRRRPEGHPQVQLAEGRAGAELGDAADKLVLFAKIYDVAPDGTKTLVHRLVAPVRVPDVTKPFTVTLPAVVHRYEKGHRLRFVIAASDDAYFGNRGIKPVTVVSAPGRAGVLELPVAGR